MNFLTEYYDFLQEGILGIDDARKICYANPAAQRILHLSPEQLNGTDLGRIFPEAPAGTEKLTLSYQTRTLEFCRYGDVSAAWPEMAVKCIHAPERKVIGGIMSFQEAAPGRTSMADENAMFNAVLDNIPCQVFIKDPRGGFCYKIANRNFDHCHSAVVNNLAKYQSLMTLIQGVRRIFTNPYYLKKFNSILFCNGSIISYT